MKWRGRRQSVNLIDLKIAPKVISVDWYTGDNYDSTAILIDTDGSLYVDGNEVTSSQVASMAQFIRIIFLSTEDVIDENNPPSPTSGQKSAIAGLIAQINSTTNSKDITISQPQSDLQVNISQYVQSLLNNT